MNFVDSLGGFHLGDACQRKDYQSIRRSVVRGPQSTCNACQMIAWTHGLQSKFMPDDVPRVTSPMVYIYMHVVQLVCLAHRRPRATQPHFSPYWCSHLLCGSVVSALNRTNTPIVMLQPSYIGEPCTPRLYHALPDPTRLIIICWHVECVTMKLGQTVSRPTILPPQILCCGLWISLSLIS